MGKLYIAYGSNLNKRQMYDRCPGAKFLGTGVIENYILQFKGSLMNAHATITPQKGAYVPVAIWLIQKRDEKSLDVYEGYHEKGYCYYDKEQIPVKFENGMEIKGMVYIMDKSKDIGFPDLGYFYTVVQGYRDCGLDEKPVENALRESLRFVKARVQSAQEDHNVQGYEKVQEGQGQQDCTETLTQIQFA